jgi:chemotaxis protein methyltransferase CheR
MPLTSHDIDAICGLVIDLCGVYLDESKSYLIESRLAELVKRSGCANYVELASRIRCAADHALRNELIDAITTNETTFFRDQSPFDALAHDVIPSLIECKAGSHPPKRIRIWSAACSTGQEAYSIAMSLSEILPDIHHRDVTILGTDISDLAISRASRGWYSNHEVERGLTADRLNRFLHPQADGWQVNDSLRGLVTFQRYNLLDPRPISGKFDIIFCRNVAIYFTPAARRKLFHRLATMLTPTGYLFVGSQESLADLATHFSPQQHSRAVFYRPNLLQPA